MLQELTLRNFKAWKHVDSMRLSPITGLFGANSSGKSSIIQSLLLLKQTLESTDRSLPLHFGAASDYVELGWFRDVIWSLDPTLELTFGLKWNLPARLNVKNPENPTDTLFTDDKMAFETVVDSENGEKMRVKKFTYEFSDTEFSLSRKEAGNQYQLDLTKQQNGFRFMRTQGRPWDLPRPLKFYGFPDQVNTYYQNAGFLADLQRQLVEQFDRIYYLGPLREYPQRRYVWSGSEPIDVGQRGERVVDAILAAREKGNYIRRGGRKRLWTLDKMLAHRLEELGLIHSFSVDRLDQKGNIYEVHVQKSRNSSKVLVTDVGFGVSQVLPVLTLCYYVSEGSTIIFEQPEIHLHPSVQSGLADVFIDVAMHRKIQIIVESHSEHLLTRLQRRMAEEQISKDDIALYFCRTDGDRAVLDPLELDMFGSIENWPKDFFGDRFAETAAREEAALQRQIQTDNGG